jgi:hypothetical protein
MTLTVHLSQDLEEQFAAACRRRRITISVPDGSPPLVLTRKGNTLEGAPEGETMKMKFVRQ